jgi:hypothetical protein
VTDLRLQEENLIARFAAMSTSSTNGYPIRIVTMRKYRDKTLAVTVIDDWRGSTAGHTPVA